MERTQERPQLQIISRNDEIPDPVAVKTQRELADHRHKGEFIITDFLDRVGLMVPDFDENKYDTRFMRKDLESYYKEIITDPAGEEDLIHKDFISHYLSLEKVLVYCHAQLYGALEKLNKIPRRTGKRAWRNAFRNANHWRKVDLVLHRGLPVPEKKLLRLRASIADISETEHRQAAIYHLPTTH